MFSAWLERYIDLGAHRPARRRCVNYRRLANHLAGLSLDAKRDEVLARLRTFQANDPDFWDGLLERLGKLPAEADWYTMQEALCCWLERENPAFSSGEMLEWLTEGL